MKKQLHLFTFLMLFSSSFNLILAQNNSQNFKKYQNMRQQLVEQFMVIGEGTGKSLPAMVDNAQFKKWKNVNNAKAGATGDIRWVDPTFYLGDYLGVLATEYALFQKNGLPTAATVEELYYALKTIHRLDATAEHYLFNIPKSNRAYEQNGFFIRDDVSEQFVRQHFNRSSFYSSMSHEKKELNAMSQDQVIGLLYGLAFVSELCPPSLRYKGMNFQQEAKLIADRLLHQIRRHHWQVKDPVEHKKVVKGSSAVFQSYAFAKAGRFITGKRYQDWWSATGSQLLWRYSQHPFTRWSRAAFYNPFLKKSQRIIYDDVNNSMMLRLVAVGKSWRKRKIWVNSLAADMEVFALANAVLHHYRIPIAPKIYENLLNSAPPEGPYMFNKRNKATGGWATTNRWSHPKWRHKGVPEYFHTRGNYTGLDYMLLFNLYHLAYQRPLVTASFSKKKNQAAKKRGATSKKGKTVKKRVGRVGGKRK